MIGPDEKCPIAEDGRHLWTPRPPLVYSGEAVPVTITLRCAACVASFHYRRVDR